MVTITILQDALFRMVHSQIAELKKYMFVHLTALNQSLQDLRVDMTSKEGRKARKRVS